MIPPHEQQSPIFSHHGTIILYQAEDSQTALDVQLTDDTIWLTQAQMVELFQRDKCTVSEHIRNLFKEGKLDEEAVVRRSRTTAADGKTTGLPPITLMSSSQLAIG